MRLFYNTVNLFILILLLYSCNPDKIVVKESVTLLDTTNYVLDHIRFQKVAKIDSFFSRRYAFRAFNGAVLFAENNRIIYKNAFGYGDFRAKDTLKLNSPFQLASVSKPVTALAILMLHERGQLSLKDSIQKFFPDFPYQNITVRLLLTHRSGLPNYMYFVEDHWPNWTTPISNQKVLDLMIKYKPLRYYKPDMRYNYSNTNYCLLALIIEKVSGMSFGNYIQSHIFDPLGMQNSFVYNKAEDGNLPSKVIGYNRLGRRAENSYLNGVVGDKGIYSSVEDLFKLDRAMNSGRLVSIFSLQEAFQPAHPDLRQADNYGFGWRIDVSNPQDKVVYHTGWWKGFKTYYIRKLDKQQTIIVLTNSARIPFIPISKLENLI